MRNLLVLAVVVFALVTGAAATVVAMTLYPDAAAVDSATLVR
jgi:hypothetical protein